MDSWTNGNSSNLPISFESLFFGLTNKAVKVKVAIIQTELISHFHSIFFLTSEKRWTNLFGVSETFPVEAFLNSFPYDNVTLDQFCSFKITMHKLS